MPTIEERIAAFVVKLGELADELNQLKALVEQFLVDFRKVKAA